MKSRSPKRDEAWKMFAAGYSVEEVMQAMGSSRILTNQRRLSRDWHMEFYGPDSINALGHPVHISERQHDQACDRYREAEKQREDLAAIELEALKKRHEGGRPAGITMPCGWKCGDKLTASTIRSHFTNCPKRPK